MIGPNQKDAILAEIKANTFEYKSLHAEIIKVLDADGLIDITRTKDGTDVDLTNKGKVFIKNGGYAAIEKEKQKEKYKEYATKAIFFVLGAITVKAIDILLPLLLA